jgi:hypothetical protein
LWMLRLIEPVMDANPHAVLESRMNGSK